MARLFALHDLYVVGVLIYLLLALTTRDRFWPVMALGYLAHLLLIVAFLALPLSLILRRWGSVAIQGTCLLAFVLLFGDTVVGRGPVTAEPGAPALTVATFNLGDGLVEVDELEDFLRESRADIVGLEEVTPSAALAAELVRDLYPFQEVRAGGNTGKAILSKFRIQEVQWLEFHPERPDLMAFIDFDGTEIAVLVVHPPPPAAQLTGIKPREYTSRQWDLVIDLIENSDGPMIVMGDMNIAEMHEPYDRLENAGLQDLYREVGRGPGFTNPARFPRIGDRDTPLDWLPVVPFVRIDYIWASEEWQPVDARVDDARGSDHRPVVATVALRAER